MSNLCSLTTSHSLYLIFSFLFRPFFRVGTERHADFKNKMNGTLRSRNYPFPYLKNQHCTWRITVPEGYYVNVTFMSFKLENSLECKKDSLEVVDGDKMTGYSLGKYCKTKPPSLVSSGTKMFIQFKTDDEVEHKGFSALFTAVKDDEGKSCGDRPGKGCL